MTAVLRSPGRAGRDVVDELLPLVYDELREMAHRQLAREQRATVSTTGLVHERDWSLARAWLYRELRTGG